ncbi:winged helix-turn-helix domain-containing protein [Paenibacillus silviterrae]|uniref:winged helix-turn-helix domain-containing protein n=1 Tax=Paenibacillus silviterrae TaxID=3242194 RepID=UPI0025435728|nr:helix-turn-helix domain-containing protein [Paenibacillus chinjuensis]
MVTFEIQESRMVESPEQAIALLHPLRADIVSRLAEPASAAEIARALGEAPQRMNYHLKALEKVGLIRKVGTRQVRNLVEVLYQAIAKTFILAESLSLPPETLERLKEHGSLLQLVTTAEQMKKDAVMLMEEAETAAETPSATLQFQVHLKDGEERQAFIEEYAAMVEQLVNKYHARKQGAAAYRVLLAAYPKPGEGGDRT